MGKVELPDCIRCNHPHVFIEGGNYCSNSSCFCSVYSAQTPNNIAEMDKAIAGLTSAYEKIEHMLENVPEFRELTNKEFVFLYWHYTVAYVVPPALRRLLTDPETIRRAKQKVVENRPSLGPVKEGSTDMAKLAKEWGVLEWVISNG